MLEFKKIEIKDIETIKTYISLTGKFSCENNFVNLLVWQCAFNNMFAVCENQLFIKSGEGEEETFRLPLGDNLKRGMELLREYTKKENPPLWVQRGDRFDEFAETFVNDYELVPERDAFDYIYLQEDLANLSGKKYHSKRNHISAFSKKYNWEFKEITEKDIPLVLDCAEKWYKQNSEKLNSYMECEKKGISIILDNFGVLKIKGGAIYVDGEMVAFTLGSPINEEIFDINIEKALPDFPEAYAVINNEFAKTLGEYKYINREDDMGLEGLRKAKLSYKPTILLEKYYCIPKKERCKEIYNQEFGEVDNEFANILFEKCFKYCEFLEENGKITSLLFALPCSLEEREALYIFAVVTAPEYRGNGYAKKLIEKIKQENKDKILILRPVNEDIIEYYKKLGFEKMKASNEEGKVCLVPKNEYFDLANKYKENKGEYTAMYYSHKEENLENIYFPYSMP